MRKHILLLTSLCFFSLFRAQTPITFTILNTSGSNSITCSTPTIHLLCITNYTSSFVTYTLSGPSGTAIGNNFPIYNPGTYSLTAFVSNTINSTQTLAIGINTLAPSSNLTPTTQNISCSFTSVTTLTASANPSINVTHFFITPSGSSLAVSGATATYPPGIAGTHTHVLVNNTNGCKTSKIFLVNSVSSIPTLTITCPQNFTLGCGNNSICSVGLGGNTNPPGAPIGFTVLSIASSTNYIPNSQNLYQLSNPGTYTTICRDVTTGCEARVPFSIVSNTSSPNITLFTNTPTLSCNNANSVIYGISTSPNTSYSWSVPGSTLSSNNFSIGVGVTGVSSNSVIGTVTFQVIDNANACTSETYITLFQNTYPPIALIGNTGSNSVTCSSPSVMLTNQSTSGIPPATFSNSLSIISQLWSGPSTPSSSGTPSIAAFSIGVYSLTVLDPNNGCTAQTTYTLGDARVFPIVNNPAGPPPYCLDPPTTTIEISPILGGSISNYTYSWISPSSATVSGQNTATLTTNAVGTYTVIVTHTLSGCTTSGNLTVTICTDLLETKEKNAVLTLYPNPSQDIFRFQNLKDSNIRSIQIFNSAGTCVKSFDYVSQDMVFDLSGEAKGIYFIDLLSHSGQHYSYKLLLQ